MNVVTRVLHPAHDPDPVVQEVAGLILDEEESWCRVGRGHADVTTSHETEDAFPR